MAGLQYSVAVRDAKNDSVEVTIGTAPKLQLRSGSVPATCATADSGTLLAELTLPSDWMAASSAGVKAKSGTWSVAALAAGTIGHYRIKDTAGTTCHEQGDVTITGGGGTMTVDNTSVAVAQVVTVTSYQKTSGNA